MKGDVINSNAGLSEKSGATNEMSVSFIAFRIKTRVIAFIIPVINIEKINFSPILGIPKNHTIGKRHKTIIIEVEKASRYSSNCFVNFFAYKFFIPSNKAESIDNKNHVIII